MARGGTHVVVGLFVRQLTIPCPLHTPFEYRLLSSYVRRLGEMRDLMELVASGKIEAVEVATRDASEATNTLQEMKEGKIQGLVALTHD